MATNSSILAWRIPWTEKPGRLQSIGSHRVQIQLKSDSSAFSKSSLNICNFSVHVLLKPSLENFEHYFANMGFPCG